MGTNFYYARKSPYGALDREAHIGKRSAAGLYCWDCGLTLCKGGEAAIHYDGGDKNWHAACPECGKKPQLEGLDKSTGGRELGFNKNKPARKTGVASCSSFTWAIQPGTIPNNAIIVDEYGRTYTRREFADVLAECPVQYTDSIGEEFS